jgi:hypothetical protein
MFSPIVSLTLAGVVHLTTDWLLVPAATQAIDRVTSVAVTFSAI